MTINSIQRKLKKYAFWGGGLLLLASCQTIKYTYQKHDGIAKGIYRDMENQTDTSNIASLSWTQMFTDPILQDDIRKALQNNFDLNIARTRINQARANFRQSKAALFPTVDANGEVTLSRAGRQSGFDKVYDMSVGASWEVDIWGKLRDTKKAYLNSLLESEAYKRSVRTELIAEVATYYYTLVAYHSEMKILEQTLSTYKEDVRTMKKLMESDRATGADLVESQANEYSASISISELKQSIRETENSLCLLLAEVPGPVKYASLDKQLFPVDLKTGVPVQLLSNRPDVQEAEFQLRYYSDMVHVARAYFYPQLNITGEAGYSKDLISEFFNPSNFFANLVGGLTAPIFENRKNKQRLEVAKAEQKEYLLTFKQTVLSAGVEVSNALYAYAIGKEKMQNRNKEVEALTKATNYTKKLLQFTSSTNYTDVLTAEQSLLSARLDEVGDQLDQLSAVIELYRSLGGGIK